MFNRTNLLIVLIAAAGALAGFFAGGFLHPQAPLPVPNPHALKVGDASTPVRLPDVDGKSRALAEWQGKLIVLNFWASWCGPCREEMPLLDRSQQRYAERGLQIIGVAADTTLATKAFLARHPIHYPILIDDPDRGEDVSAAYGNTRSVLPYSVLIGRDGAVLAQHAGNFSEAGFTSWIEPHL
jgi:thiol-disulfide isomerase/thioredoxin